MPVESYDNALEKAAERCGIEARFWDIFGREHPASKETLRAIVQALGIPTDSAESLQTAIEEREKQEWTRMLAPTLVVPRAEGGIALPFTLPERELRGHARLCIRLETGEEIHSEQALDGIPVGERRDCGELWVRAQAHIGGDIPLGYHEAEMSVGGRQASARLIVAPTAAWQPDELKAGKKMAGFAVSLYGLRSARNWGFGDFTDLQQLCTWAARELCVSFIALNPLHAIHNRRPYNTSPYLPNSIFFQNLLYVDLEKVEEWPQCRRAQTCFGRAQTQTELHLLRESPEVEYERVARVKTRFFKLLFAEFLRSHWRTDTARSREFHAFQREAGDLLTRFGLYCALDEYLHRRNPDLWIWTDWPEEYQSPDSPEVLAFSKKHWRSVLFYQYAAWETARQLEATQKHAIAAGLSIGLYHDLALATDRFGSDIWAHREFFAPGCRVGSPPDDFSPQGQDWGFPPPNTLRHRADGYQLFRESILRSCRYGGALRIDHVMRFFRLYWIPDGMNATQGAYVRDRADDLVRILALESVRNRVLVVGEDLGTVEPYIREMLGTFGILSYRLFYFERHGDGSYRLANEYPRQALVSSSTHDLPTLTGFWKGADIEARKTAGVLDEAGRRAQWADRAREKQRMMDALAKSNLLPQEYPRDAACIPELDNILHDAAINFLAATPSMLLLVNQEDLTREQYQQNLPGTTAQYPNWARKMLFTLEQLEQDDRARELTRGMRERLKASGRV